TPNDYLQYAAIIVFANVGSNIFNFIHVKQFCTVKLVKDTNWKYHLRPILIIFASSVAVTIYVSSDTTILGLLKGSYDVGIYSTSVRIYQMAQGVLSAILTVTIPRLAMLWGQHRLKEYRIVLSKVIKTLEILVLPASVGLMMLSKEVVLIIAGKKYLNSVNSLRIITWAIIFSIFAWIFSDCVLIPAKRESKVLRNTVITGIVNIILNFIFIPFWSYDGTSLSTVIAEGMVMILNGITCWDIIKDIIVSREVFYNLITSIIGCIGIVIICMLCKIAYSDMIIEMIMSVILSVIMYGAILFLLRNKVMLDVISNLKFRLKKR
ncbi:oligosaccharide flippase family protein, partial [Lactobacillus helveticus]|uniref:oligosaccharide flippase family protein n=1 Tax=Lactobacillus helveticus TaxID=1587 RepID=UPI0015629288